VISGMMTQFEVNGSVAEPGNNMRVVQYDNGSVLIPQGPEYPAMTVYSGTSFGGSGMPLQSYEKYDGARLGAMKGAISSFRLKRGYEATIAQNDDGTGVSKNYVAQDCDINIDSLPPELDKKINFIRIFPWRWVCKKGISGDIGQKMNLGWWYDWSISKYSTVDVQYVPIRQHLDNPNLNQDWKARGATELLGYNEPDHKDQSNLTVDQALAGWPALLGTGLRLGSPAVSDGGLGWLYQFMDRADQMGLRVDFVAVHYYRAVGNPADPEAAARQLYNYVKQIHDRTHRSIWLTEWNNGANWTKAPKPTYAQEKAAVAAMIKMMDSTPFVERYALYNWVEDVRNVQRKDGSLTPAGEAYRDEVSPLSYVQPKPELPPAPPAPVASGTAATSGSTATTGSATH
jgi:hypothetical protein